MKIGDNFHAFLWRSMTANNSNCFLIDGSKRILIDPGHRALFQHVEQGLGALNLTLEDIDVVLCTHAHPDHIEAVQQVRGGGVKFGLHQAEWELIQAMAPAVQGAGKSLLEAYQPDFFLQEGDLQIGDTALQVLHTPGHSPGSVCFYSAADKVLVTGDLIFKDGVGRTDLPGGDGQQLKQSLEKIAGLSAEYMLPGHGPYISGEKNVAVNNERIGRMYRHYL